ncbi:MAG: aspartate carbamoyltransferase catalytic subunit [Candidatus Aureabacteria bacterium]|nr:aspartate carbamoyltransferase catalytic subunit [Candidatus Auribacterota bacterium]
MHKWNRKHLLSIEELSREEILTVLQTAESFKDISLRPIKKSPVLRGKTIVLLFYEPSTRTSNSFSLAAKRLSADVVNISVNASSVQKGESLIDTAKNIEALKIHTIIIRHSRAGAPMILARHIDASVINAGDGYHEHPTQALLDMFTIKQRKGFFEGLKVTIVGDILHSRVARSNIWGLSKLGAEVTVCGPPTMIPVDIEAMGAKVSYNLKEAVADADVVNLLRVQFERESGVLFPSVREYAAMFSMDDEMEKYLKEDALIMHPGPINRGVEISSRMADGKRSVILEQVTNGLAVRMAVLYLISGEKEKTRKSSL